MINVKKGVAKSLQQTDKVAVITSGQTGIVAGMVCRVHTNGQILKGGSDTGINGFAIQNQTDGDVIDSGNKLSLYLLDGSSVIETDQIGAGLTAVAADFAIGAPVYAEAGNTGKVSNASAGGVTKVLGYVEGIRNLPSTGTSAGFKYWTTAPVLGIKLAA